MAFISLGTKAVGDPVNKDYSDLIKDNFDDHETRLDALEGGANKIIVFDTLVRNLLQYQTFDGVGLWRAPSDFVLVSAEVSVVGTTGTGGSFEIDLTKSATLGGTFNTVFTTKPSVASGDGDDATSSNAVFITGAGGSTISQGEWLKLDVTAVMTELKTTHILIYGESS